MVKNAIINAAAGSSDLSPLEFFLSLMRQGDLDLEVRIAVAQQALPFAHSRPKRQIGAQNTNGKPWPQVKDKIGPRVEVRKVNADNVDGRNIMPLDFLLRVMRDRDCPPNLRLRAASIADCKKLNRLKALDANSRTPEEEQELERLKTRYGDIPLDSTLIEFLGLDLPLAA